MEGKRIRATGIEKATLMVLALTLLGVAWYTVETARLRMATQKQIKRSYMPIVILEFKNRRFVTDEGYDLRPTIRNVGFGPAFNIEVSGIQNDVYRTDFDLVPGLGKDAEYELLPLALHDDDGKQSVNIFGKLLTTVPVGKTLVFSSYPITISFLDGTGERHQIVQEIQVQLEKHEVRAIVKSMPSLDERYAIWELPLR